MRPIDADALENMGYELQRIYQKDANTMVYEVKKIADVPTIETKPVRRGRWEKYSPFVDTIVCSECGWNEISEEWATNYCPNCGAKMEK